MLVLSCNKDKTMKSVRTISFDIKQDVSQQGFSDAADPFLFFTTSKHKLYKYYFNSDKRDSVDLKTETKVKHLNRYFILFNKENFILHQYLQIYNSSTAKVYKLDSLTNHNGMEYDTTFNNVNSWRNNKLLLSNFFTCDLYNEKSADVMETMIKCEQLNKLKPSYSILNFENDEVKLSSITYKDIMPHTKDNSAEPWFKATVLFKKDVILYNNHFIDGVYEIDENGIFKKAFTIKSKYTRFEDVELFKNDDLKSVYDNAINYSTQVNGVLYDEYRNKTVVILVHGTKDIENNGEKKRSNRPFSVMVYDEDYNLENEYLFNNTKYNYNHVFVCKEGLIIDANNNMSFDYKPNKLTYEIFTY